MIRVRLRNRAVIKSKIEKNGCCIIKSVTGQPKILTAKYNLVPLTITIMERNDNT